jgi:hypothetical protein
MTQEQADEVGAGAAVNESAISSLALGAEEDFGGRKTNVNNTPPSVEGEVEDDAEGEDADADGRTQWQGKGAGASSGSERGTYTYKARSRKSAKSDSKEKDKEKVKERKGKKKKDKREGRDDEAARLRRAAKGRVAEWLGNLEAHEPVSEPEPEVTPEVNADQDLLSPLALATSPPVESPPTRAAAVNSASPTVPPPVVESEPNPRSSGFISVSTLRRAPISLPPVLTTTHDVSPTPTPVRRFAHRFPPNPRGEMKYDVKSARGGRGGQVTAVASIWAEAAKAASAGAPTRAGQYLAKGNAARIRTTAASKLTFNPTPIKPMTSFIDPVRAAPAPAKTPRPRQTPPAAAKDDNKLAPGAVAAAGKERDSPRPTRALFGLGSAAAATPSSPALSSSIATPVLSSTASLARPPLNPASAPRANHSTNLSPSASPRPPFQPQPQPQLLPSPAAGQQRSPIVNGGGFKAELAFGQARLRELIKRYQGQQAP